jgi:hypothetical protein
MLIIFSMSSSLGLNILVFNKYLTYLSLSWLYSIFSRSYKLLKVISVEAVLKYSTEDAPMSLVFVVLQLGYH